MRMTRQRYPHSISSCWCYGNDNSNGGVSTKRVCWLCFASFCFGRIIFKRFWVIPDSVIIDESSMGQNQASREFKLIAKCEKKEDLVVDGNVISQFSQTHDIITSLNRTISSLEMQLATARASKAKNEKTSQTMISKLSEHSKNSPKFFFVIGIMTAFNSRKRRDSIRDTWMPQGFEEAGEREKGIVMRFVIGHSVTPGGVLDRHIKAEEEQHLDFLRLNHVEGYHVLSSKTQIYFSTALANWDADYYVKVDDDVLVNLGMVGSILARHRSKPRVYVGCMKSGPVLAQKGVKYHEPEFWNFGEEGNKYFRHATGQIYGISKDLATYIMLNRNLLHMYANEDVSLGSCFIGLDVEHIDDRSLCCRTPTECERKAQAGNACAASFDWSCSGICKSVERMKEIHQRCGEGDEAIWHSSF